MNKNMIKIGIFIIMICVIGIASRKYFFKNWAPYYQEKLYKEPRPLLIQALQFCSENDSLEKQALDLGAGSGNDTAFLLKNGWTVYANDKETESVQIISSRKDIEPYQKQLHLIHASFTDLPWNSLPSFDLIYAGYALPFLDKSSFYDVWNNIIAKLKQDGILAVHFFDERHTGFNWWEKRSMNFFTKDEIIDLCKGFDIKLLEEKEYSFSVVAKKSE